MITIQEYISPGVKMISIWIMDVPDVSSRKTTTATDGENTKGENGSAYEWF